AVKNCASVQEPIPVASGVRLEAKEVPQGPVADVSPIVKSIYDWAVLASYSGNCSSAGCPERSREVSNTMLPSSATFLGVWQSWQPMEFTKNSPLLTGSSFNESSTGS